MAKPEEFSVKVSGITSGIRHEEVRRVFEDAGYNTITDVYMPPRKEFGFVRFSSEDEAYAASEMQGLNIRGVDLSLELAVGKKTSSEDLARKGPPKGGKGKGKGGGMPMFDSGFKGAKGGGMHGPSFDVSAFAAPSKKSGEHSVWVGNLPSSLSKDELHDMFRERGVDTMTDVYIPGGNKGFGFVRFSTLDEVDHAIQQCQGLQYGDVELELKSSSKESRGGDARKGGPPMMMPMMHGPASGSYGPPAGAFGYGGGYFDPYAGGYADPYGGGYGPPQAMPAKGGGKSGKGEHSVWVGNLPESVGVDELREAFQDSGVHTMSDVYIPTGKGFGFVRFHTMEEVDRALHKCRGMQLKGEQLELKSSSTEKHGGAPAAAMVAMPMMDPYGWGPGKGGFGPGPGYADDYGPPAKKQNKSEHSVWVGNLSDSITKEELGGAFKEMGIDTMTDVYLPPGKGFGFVRFATRGEVEDAVDRCAGMEVGGMQVELKISSTEKRGPAGMAAGAAGGGGPPMGVGYPSGYGGGFGYPGDDFGAYGGLQGPPSAGRRQVVAVAKGEVSVKVSNLAPGTTSDELRAAFVDLGVDSMSDVYIPTGRAFGFLRFMRLREAQTAMNCNDVMVRDSPVTLELAEGGKKTSQELAMETQAKRAGKGAIAYHHNQAAFDTAFAGQSGEVSVKVGNLPPDASPEEVCEAFAAQGVDFMTDCYLPQGRKFGFLRFASAADGSHAMQHSVSLRGRVLEMEFAAGRKRTSEEMAGGEMHRQMERQMRPPPREAFGPRDVPGNPDISADAPSLKVSGVPAGTTSEELHKAVVAAGCRGNITDVYIPKGDRGFGFVRFGGMREAEAELQLQVNVRGTPVELEISVAQRKGKREMAAQSHGPEMAYGFPPNGGYGYGPPEMYGGYGPAKGGHPGYGCGGPYGGKGPKGKGKGYW